jgi:hypothetical protein
MNAFSTKPKLQSGVCAKLLTAMKKSPGGSQGLEGMADVGADSAPGSTRRSSASMSPGSVSQSPPPAARAANLPLRQRFRIEIIFAAINRRTGEPGDLRDEREAAPTGSSHLS